MISDEHGYSAEVRIALRVGEHTLSVGAIGPTYCRLAAPAEIEVPPGAAATSVVTIDGKPHERQVRLARGIGRGDVRVEFGE